MDSAYQLMRGLDQIPNTSFGGFLQNPPNINLGGLIKQGANLLGMGDSSGLSPIQQVYQTDLANDPSAQFNMAKSYALGGMPGFLVDSADAVFSRLFGQWASKQGFAQPGDSASGYNWLSEFVKRGMRF